MADCTPYVLEQVDVLLKIAEKSGQQEVLKPKADHRQVDCWQHIHDELRFLKAMLIKHPPYRSS